MGSEKRGNSRSAFFATVEVVELQSSAYLKGQTSDLSLTGCYLDMLNPLPVTTEVRVRLTHTDETFTALGMVTHSQANFGMGIGFTTIEVDQEWVLDQWLAGID